MCDRHAIENIDPLMVNCFSMEKSYVKFHWDYLYVMVSISLKFWVLASSLRMVGLCPPAPTVDTLAEDTHLSTIEI